MWSPGFSGAATPFAMSRCQRTLFPSSLAFTAMSRSTARSDVVVAHGPIAIEPQARDVHDERIAGIRACYIEGPRLRISSEHPRYAFFIGAARVHGCGVHGVSWSDGQHRFVERRNLSIERGGNKFMALRGTGRPRLN